MSDHGGKRKGAGRPPRQGPPLVAITVRLEPEDAARFKALCKESGRSQAGQVAAWANEPREVICSRCSLRESRGEAPDCDF